MSLHFTTGCREAPVTEMAAKAAEWTWSREAKVSSILTDVACEGNKNFATQKLLHSPFGDDFKMFIKKKT